MTKSELEMFKHPSGNHLLFNKNRHTYFMDNNRYKIFTSGTTFISKFFPKFDLETISENYAKKYKMDQKEVKTQWKLKSDDALLLGNLCHDYMDALLKGDKLPKPITKKHKACFGVSKSLLKHLFKDHEYIFSEFGIASPNWKIAGMIDCAFRKDSTLVLVDWKTSRLINKINTFQTGFTPIEHLDDCNFNHYALQLNLYRAIIEETDYIKSWFPWIKEVKMIIFHIQKDQWTPYKIPNMNYEIKRMIKHRSK